MATRGPSDPRDIDKLLAKLRDDPLDTNDETERALLPIFQYLMSIPAHASDGLFHWFCEKADPIALEAATFLLRLFAYDSGGVEKWKQRLQLVLKGCCDCVRGGQLAKLTSEQTYVQCSFYTDECTTMIGLARYLSAFPADVLKDFMLKFDDWELGFILPRISNTTTSIEAHPPVIFHALSNLHILRDPRILAIFDKRDLPSSLPDWPTDPPPPGLFYLQLHRNEDVRRWASTRLIQSRVRPIAKELFVRPYIKILEILSGVLASQGGSHPKVLSASSDSTLGEEESEYLSSDPVVTWQAFSELMRFSPPELFQRGSMTKLDVRRLIAGHLHDTGPR